MTELSVVFTELLAGGIAPLAVRALPGGSVVVGGTAIGAAAGLMGNSIIDRFLGDGDDGDADGEDDPLGGGGGGGDDPFGGDFDMGDDGEDGFGMGEFDDDPFGEEGGDGDTAELEERIDDLEGEVASLSSTVNTVRSENKEISETVDDIAEDVRGLLDIYEMVTRGINPFVDDDSLGGGGFEGGSSLGLFDADEDDAEDEDLDDDIAGADAESFFDEDLLDDDGFDDGDSPDDTENDFDMMDDTDSADGGGGKSFDELKAEYESGDADWAEGDDGASKPVDDFGEDTGDGGDDFGGMDDDIGGMDDDIGGMNDAFDDGLDEVTGLDDEFEDSGSDDAMSNGHRERPTEASRNGHGGSPPTNADGGEASPDRSGRDEASDRSGRDETGFEFVGDSTSPGGAATKPYLTELPEGYVGDLIVIEWLESLVEESDPTDAARAVGYYERVEWISPGVADRLRDFLTGFGPIDANRVDDPGTEVLTLDHHVRSLQYIRQLNGASAESLVIGRWDRISDGPRGVGGGRGGDDGRSFLERDPREVTDGR